MKKTKITIASVFVLALTVLASEALAGLGGGGVRGGGPRMGANFQPAQPDNSWVPGPYCPYAQGPNQNFQGRQGPGPRGAGQNFWRPGPYCPFGQGSNQNIQGRQGPGRGGFGQGFAGRGLGPCGQGYGPWDMTIQRGPMTGRGGRGPAMLGRGGRGFHRRNAAPQGWGMNNWQGQSGPGGIGRQGPRMNPRWFAPEDRNPPVPPRGRGWAPGLGQGWRQGWGPNPQLQQAPDANAPEPPIVEDQTEKPQVK